MKLRILTVAAAGVMALGLAACQQKTEEAPAATGADAAATAPATDSMATTTTTPAPTDPAAATTTDPAAGAAAGATTTDPAAGAAAGAATTTTTPESK